MSRCWSGTSSTSPRWSRAARCSPMSRWAARGCASSACISIFPACGGGGRRRRSSPISPSATATGRAVLMGDLNEWSTRGGCLRDFAEHHLFAPCGRSFHARRPIAQLDQIMVSPDLEILAQRRPCQPDRAARLGSSAGLGGPEDRRRPRRAAAAPSAPAHPHPQLDRARRPQARSAASASFAARLLVGREALVPPGPPARFQRGEIRRRKGRRWSARPCPGRPAPSRSPICR